MQKKILILALLLIISNCYSYDYKLSKKLGYLTYVSYCTPQSIIDWSCGECCENTEALEDIQYISENCLFAFIGYNRKMNEIQVSFRGTLCANNWGYNLNIEKKDYSCPNCQVHSGFLQAYEHIKPAFRYIIMEYYLKKYASAKLTIVGHSLGGALAVLATSDLYVKYNKRVDLIQTIGQPRVGNYEFTNWFFYTVTPKTIYRVTNQRDPVVQIPMNSQGYEHFGPNIQFDDTRFNYKVCDVECTWNPLVNIESHSNYFGMPQEITYNTDCGQGSFDSTKLKTSFTYPKQSLFSQAYEYVMGE